jgi:hypothetical protein
VNLKPLRKRRRLRREEEAQVTAHLAALLVLSRFAAAASGDWVGDGMELGFKEGH